MRMKWFYQFLQQISLKSIDMIRDCDNEHSQKLVNF